MQSLKRVYILSMQKTGVAKTLSEVLRVARICESEEKLLRKTYHPVPSVNEINTYEYKDVSEQEAYEQGEIRRVGLNNTKTNQNDKGRINKPKVEYTEKTTTKDGEIKKVEQKIEKVAEKLEKMQMQIQETIEKKLGNKEEPDRYNWKRNNTNTNYRNNNDNGNNNHFSNGPNRNFRYPNQQFPYWPKNNNYENKWCDYHRVRSHNNNECWSGMNAKDGKWQERKGNNEVKSMKEPDKGTFVNKNMPELHVTGVDTEQPCYSKSLPPDKYTEGYCSNLGCGPSITDVSIVGAIEKPNSWPEPTGRRLPPVVLDSVKGTDLEPKIRTVKG